MPLSFPSDSPFALSFSCKACRSQCVVKYVTNSPYAMLTPCKILKKFSAFSKSKASFLCLLGPSKFILTSMDPAHIMAFNFFSAYFTMLLILVYFHKCHVVYSLQFVPTPHVTRTTRYVHHPFI